MGEVFPKSEDTAREGPYSRSVNGPRLLYVTTVPQSLRTFWGQAAYMQQHGFDLEAASSPGELLQDFADRYEVPVHGVSMERRIAPLRDLTALRRLRAVIRKVKPDIVHANTPKGGLLGSLAARREGVPVVIYHIRGLPYQSRQGWRRKMLMSTEKRACAAADAVFCVSHSIRKVAIADGLVAEDKIRTFLGGSGNGVDATGRYNPANYAPDERQKQRAALDIPVDAVVLGFIGRLVRDKGVRELASAWFALRERHPKLHLVLGGPVEPQDPVPPEILQRLQSDPRVHWTGYVVDIAPLYTAFDLVVLPTYREGFPNVPLEAAAMGLPCVSTLIPGCVDAVEDGVTGLLVPPATTRELEAALDRYLCDPELRRQHGAAGRERVLQQFRQEGIWEEVRQSYLSLLSQSSRTRPEA